MERHTKVETHKGGDTHREKDTETETETETETDIRERRHHQSPKRMETSPPMTTTMTTTWTRHGDMDQRSMATAHRVVVTTKHRQVDHHADNTNQIVVDITDGFRGSHDRLSSRLVNERVRPSRPVGGGVGGGGSTSGRTILSDGHRTICFRANNHHRQRLSRECMRLTVRKVQPTPGEIRSTAPFPSPAVRHL